MLKLRKLLYLFSLATLAAGGCCCLPRIPLCNECIFNGLTTLAALMEATRVTQ